jgi:hypothetical protein
MLKIWVFYLWEPAVVQVEYAAPHSVTCLLESQQENKWKILHKKVISLPNIKKSKPGI